MVEISILYIYKQHSLTLYNSTRHHL